MIFLDLIHILAIFTLPGCKTTNLFYCGLRTHRLFENLMLILRCKTTIYFIVGYTHADIFRILILFLFYVRYTWHDMTPYLPSKYNEVLLGLSYYNRKKNLFFERTSDDKVCKCLVTDWWFTLGTRIPCKTWERDNWNIKG